MSIAVLNQVYDEARRLAVAGSVVARGDFRLKKLLPPLEQAGAKAPVFAKAAECARAVIDGPEDTSAESLLELMSLATAVLYTQGETGIAGPLEPIETVEFAGTTVQTSARLLKPLLEALRSTGSGRLELVKDAHERGAFRDLRLVKPALDGLDDSYAEIADFLAEKVLPMYGRTILPELRRTYDPKGVKGHARRLRLMHAIDPVGTRDLVKQALDAGSNEVKVAAIACLGTASEDVANLTEQSSAKSQDVRGAAYHALAAIDDPAAVAVLEKALAGKDIELVASGLRQSGSDRATKLLVAEIGREFTALPKTKDKKLVSEKAHRLLSLIRALPTGAHSAADALMLDLFARRGELAKVKGETFSGSDVAEVVIARMAGGPKSLQATVARAHPDLDAASLGAAFEAARQALPPAEVYDLFAGYLTAEGRAKKGKGTDARERAAIVKALHGDAILWYDDQDDFARSLDPRWLDLAVRIKFLTLIHAVGRPGHPVAEAFIQSEFDAAMKKGKDADKIREVISVMIRLRHPKATDALIAAYEKSIGKVNANSYWYYHLIPGLPKSAVPRLEEVLPKLKDREADQWLAAIQELREKA